MLDEIGPGRGGESVGQSVKGLAEGRVGDRVALGAAAVEHRAASPVRCARELGHEARLAGARLTGDEDNTTVAGAGTVPRPFEHGHRLRAGDERDQIGESQDHGHQWGFCPGRKQDE